MQNAPSQRDVKTLLSDLVKSGSRKRMANILGVTEGEISRRFNINDDRKLSIAEGLREWWALTGADPEAAEAFKHYVCGLYESWCSPVKRTGELSLLVSGVNKETGDLVQARLAGKPAHEQRKEAVEIVKAAQRFITELDASEEAARIREAV